jgi:hypothetical protein
MDDPRIFDGYHRTTGKPGRNAAFYIYQEQHDRLRTQYAGVASIIVRLLLEKFLDGQLPEVEQQLEELKKSVASTS